MCADDAMSAAENVHAVTVSFIGTDDGRKGWLCVAVAVGLDCLFRCKKCNVWESASN